MTTPEAEVRGFRVVFIVAGIVYALLAGSALARGVAMLGDFGVSADELASPVLTDFFAFFYELMTFVGALMVLFGLSTRGRRNQRIVATVFAIANVAFALRDLRTSDTRFGNHLYQGSATIVFVIVDLAFAAAFAALVLASLRSRPQPSAPPDIALT
jgi:hypothetical protein